MITVEKTNADVRITVPNNAVPAKVLNRVVSWLRLEETVQHSKLTEAEADRIADEIKADWWTANKHRFIPASEQ
jgi:hypothetical protein